MKSKAFKKKVRKTLLFYNILFIIITFLFIKAIPKLLIYPPNSINTEFERHIDDGFFYDEQSAGIIAVALIASNATFLLQLREIKGWEEYVNDTEIDEEKKKRIQKIKKQCYTMPSKLYVFHAFVPALAAAIGLALTGVKSILVAKISVVVLMIFITIGLLIYVFSKNLLASVLRELKNTENNKVKFNINSYKTRMFLQFFPLVLLMGTFAYLITDAVEIEEKGNVIFNKYYSDLQNLNIKQATSVDDVKSKLNSIEKIYDNDTLYIITKDQVIYQDTDEEISDFFKTYTWFYDGIHRAYGYYATSIQSAFEIVNINGEDYACGVMYYAQAHSGYAIIFLTIALISLLVIIFLAFFARDFAKPITKVSEYMNRLASGESVDYNKKLPVTTGDEIGDLTFNFNKILDKEKQYVETIKKNQDILIENERLSSLGQLIGGIAHNLKTPIMSVSGYLVAMENLAKEYRDSIGNPNVTKEDYEAITNEMKEWIDKSKDYMSYMTEVINAAKGQAVSMNASTIGSFTAYELIARTQILMKEELMRYNCNLNVKLNISEATEIKGELSAIVQVLDNLISNAMQAYGSNKGDINLTLNEDDDKVHIEVQDFAGGIAEHVREKLFKEMITTKGKDGTGLGLYMCYSTIRGRFDGDLHFETETGVGTTFYITLNKVK